MSYACNFEPISIYSISYVISTCYFFHVSALLLSEGLIAGNCCSHLCFKVHSFQWHMIIWFACVSFTFLLLDFISVLFVLFCVWWFFIVIDCKQWRKRPNKVPMHHFFLLLELDRGSPIWTSLSNILSDLCSLHAQRRFFVSSFFSLLMAVFNCVIKWKGKQ